MIGGRALVAAIAFVALGVGGAGEPWRVIGAGASRGGTLHPAMGSPLTYEVAWDWSGARWDDATHAYAFRTDRGYDVSLVAARVGLAELELVPCPQASLLSILAPREAFANHGGVHDASLVAGALAESPFDREARTFGTSRASGRAYCRVHALLAPLATTDGASVSLRGSFIAPGERTARTLDARVGLAGGALIDLQIEADAAALPDDRPASIRIVVRRDASRALDGVDLVRATPGEIAYAFLRGLAHTSSAIARPSQESR